MVYVLESVYHWERRDIADRLLQLISADVLFFLERDTLIQVLRWYRDVAGLDLADAYVAALAASRGHGHVVSFDRHMQRVPGITLIQDRDQLPRKP